MLRMIAPLPARLFLISCLMWSTVVVGQPDTVHLPPPTGPLPVGTVSFELADTDRPARFGPVRGRSPRSLMVQIWYPAERSASEVRAPYNPVSADYRKVTGNSYLRAPFVEGSGKAPVIVVVPGRGTERYLYTVLAEELSSHGYVVVSVDMPGIGYTVYGDGLVIPPSKDFRPPRGMMGGPYEKVDSFFQAPTELGVEDLTLVLRHLEELNRADAANRFTGRLQLDGIGLFGHSLGGRIAGALAARDGRVKAYASMEGIPPRAVRYEGQITFPTLLLCSDGTWPYAKENYGSMIENRSAAVFMVLLPGFGHNSLTDNPLIYPDNFRSEIDPATGLTVGRKLLLTYYDALLRDGDNPGPVLKKIEEVNVRAHE
ncbi:alpha/beta fold hydrolase [Lewinella sp. W8]|uniref:alpha/beta hydrolase family protein n=1 Tax=Lewinella sp. W8 TaxID=2528208 RepID=UPI00106808FF|nr:alpha/beta fold hydrolase [Lewinella sp. W8]MTB50084.1 alpha/beta fold hydrolase [Lewinella sp. W8]